ncbi:hypothetical protein Tco_1530916 [Tanacetum coccineum]
MSSRVSNKDVHLGEHRKQKPFLKFNELQCPTCKKCLYSANHDECVLEYLSRLNPRASAQNKDAKSHKTTKRYMPVEFSRQLVLDGFLLERYSPLAQIRYVIQWSKATTNLLNTDETYYNEKDKEISRVWLLNFVISLRKIHVQNGFTKDELHQMVSAENNTSGPVPQCLNDVCSHQFRPRSSSNDFCS